MFCYVTYAIRHRLIYMPEVLFRNELGVKQPTEVPKHAHALSTMTKDVLMY